MARHALREGSSLAGIMAGAAHIDDANDAEYLRQSQEYNWGEGSSYKSDAIYPWNWVLW